MQLVCACLLERILSRGLPCSSLILTIALYSIFGPGNMKSRARTGAGSPAQKFQASNSATLANESGELLHRILIFVVLIAGKVNCLHTKRFPLTLPTSTQLDPSQYCTSNAVTPNLSLLNVIPIGLSGSTGLA